MIMMIEGNHYWWWWWWWCRTIMTITNKVCIIGVGNGHRLFDTLLLSILPDAGNSALGSAWRLAWAWISRTSRRWMTRWTT
jgi:hypothetical protein